MIVGALILAALIVLVGFLARNMMPADSRQAFANEDDLTGSYLPYSGGDCSDNAVDADGGSH